MATDQLVLGGLVFDEWSTPETIPFGGKQALKVHKLPGGNRVIDLLGPDQDDIVFNARVYSENAPATVDALDAMRISGDVVPLSFAGNFFSVIVQQFTPKVVRYPQLYDYAISCLVVNNPMAGPTFSAPSSFDDLIGADIASALSVVGR